MTAADLTSTCSRLVRATPCATGQQDSALRRHSDIHGNRGTTRDCAEPDLTSLAEDVPIPAAVRASGRRRIDMAIEPGELVALLARRAVQDHHAAEDRRPEKPGRRSIWHWRP